MITVDKLVSGYPASCDVNSCLVFLVCPTTSQFERLTARPRRDAVDPKRMESENDLRSVSHGYVVQVTENQLWLKGLQKLLDDKAEVERPEWIPWCASSSDNMMNSPNCKSDGLLIVDVAYSSSSGKCLVIASRMASLRYAGCWMRSESQSWGTTVPAARCSLHELLLPLPQVLQIPVEVCWIRNAKTSGRRPWKLIARHRGNSGVPSISWWDEETRRSLQQSGHLSYTSSSMTRWLVFVRRLQTHLIQLFQPCQQLFVLQVSSTDCRWRHPRRLPTAWQAMYIRSTADQSAKRKCRDSAVSHRVIQSINDVWRRSDVV